jgi:hypothetical protein
MNRRRKLGLILGLVVCTGALLVAPAVRWTLVGWLRGEHFFEGRPTCYWEHVIQAEEYAGPPTPPNWWTRIRDRFLPVSKPQGLWDILHGLRDGGPDGANVLVELLASDDLDVRFWAAHTLLGIEQETEPILPVFIERLRDEDDFIRTNAAFALRRMGPAAKEAIPFLVEALEDPWEPVRVEAALALEAIDPAAAVRAGVPRKGRRPTE